MKYIKTTIPADVYQQVVAVGGKYAVHFLPELDEASGLITCVECLVDSEPNESEISSLVADYNIQLAETIKNNSVFEMEKKLSDTSELIGALERLIASNGVTDEDRAVAQARINMRDELGKVIQTAQGNGTMEDPFKVWKVGMSVVAGDWWMTDDGYLWQAKKSGVPSSSEDNEYWDIP